MNPRIEILPEKIFIGKWLTMSFSNNKTFELWSSFMPRRKEIKNILGIELYSIEVYPKNFFTKFNPDADFKKWAAIEVKNINNVPDEMETLTVPKGLYAVFIHKGPASTGAKTYNHIFTKWLPDSSYVTDNRPHLAIMGEKYKNEEPDSEEEIWIPIKQK